MIGLFLSIVAAEKKPEYANQVAFLFPTYCYEQNTFKALIFAFLLFGTALTTFLMFWMKSKSLRILSSIVLASLSCCFCFSHFFKLPQEIDISEFISNKALFIIKVSVFSILAILSIFSKIVYNLMQFLGTQYIVSYSIALILHLTVRKIIIITQICLTIGLIVGLYMFKAMVNYILVSFMCPYMCLMSANMIFKDRVFTILHCYDGNTAASIALRVFFVIFIFGIFGLVYDPRVEKTIGAGDSVKSYKEDDDDL